MRSRQAQPGRERSRRRLLAAALVVAAASVGGGPAEAACGLPADPDNVDGFLYDPRNLLRLHPRGGATLASQVRGLAVAGIGPLRAIGTLIGQANPQQKDAIGTGLGRAGGACSARSPEISRRINDLVRASADREITRAYTRFLADTDSRSPVDITTPAGKQGSGAIRGSIEPIGRPGLQPLPLGNPFAKP